MQYDFRKIEKKWRKIWGSKKIYDPDLNKAQQPFYNLMMFPYPSAEGLHIGSVRTFSGVDIYGRMKRMQGYDVLEPIGLDGFGIHSENYALKIGRHPLQHARISKKNFYRQLDSIGNGFSRRERLETYDPQYYRWTQWLFIQMFKRGLAYRKKASVNWCPSCLTVLADEQVLQGECERCGAKVTKRELEQWFFKITDYAERLLKNLESLDWSENIKIAQKNWIGRSEGAEIDFKIKNSELKIAIFTTRPDTLFGATYLVLAPEHPLIKNNDLGIKNYDEVKNYIKGAEHKSEEDRIAEGREKTGVELKGVKAINPVSNEEIPIWIADYVLGHVGTGAIMAVPAHDQRDFEFAKKFRLPIKIVVCPHYPAATCPVLDRAYEGEGHLVGSENFNGLPSEKARREIIKFAGGRKKIQYRLRDWLISRQRYWGPPIPMIYCGKCARLRRGYGGQGWLPVAEKDLPIKLPFIKNFKPTGTGKSPLAAAEKFYKVRCPKCKSWAKRETDVSDTFLDSAWYYFGYLMKGASWKAGFGTNTFDKLVKKWLPVDMYIGGAEHAVLHLMYARFVAMALHDFGYIKFEEPFEKFRAHGLITKDGSKMSKSRGNIVNPDEYLKVYGADAIRMYLAFLAPLTEGGDFRDTGIRGVTRFLKRVGELADYSRKNNFSKTKNEFLERAVQKTIKKVTEDLESLQYNTAISSLMILLNELEAHREEVAKEYLEVFLKLLAPLAPFLSEELWQEFHRSKKFVSIHQSSWPSYNPRFIIEKNFDLVVQVNGKTRGVINLARGVSQKEAERAALRIKNIQRHILRPYQKIIFIPDRLINFVI